MASSFLARKSIMASSLSFLASKSKSIMGSSSFIVPPRSSSITLRSNSCSTASSNSYAAPWLMLPPVGGKRVYSFYSLTEKKVVHLDLKLKGFGCNSTEVIGSSHGFLVLNDQQPGGHTFLYNPISGRRIDLPSHMYISSSEEIGMGPGIKKVIISDDESSAMMIFGPENRLAFCSPGRSDGWIPLGPTLLGYTDVIYSKRHKIFTCCTKKSDVEEWDLLGHLNWVPEVWLKLDVKCKLQLKHLWWSDIEDLIVEDVEEPYVVFAEHSDQLYFVCRYIMGRTTYLQNINRFHFPLRDWDDCFPRKTIGFDVYKLTPAKDDTTLQLELMEGSLDNLVMFIGLNHSFALPAQDYPELKPNSIYFTDHPDHTPLVWKPGANDTAIYYFNDRTFFPLEYPPNQNDETVNEIDVPVQPLWFTPSPH